MKTGRAIPEIRNPDRLAALLPENCTGLVLLLPCDQATDTTGSRSDLPRREGLPMIDFAALFSQLFSSFWWLLPLFVLVALLTSAWIEPKKGSDPFISLDVGVWQ